LCLASHCHRHCDSLILCIRLTRSSICPFTGQLSETPEHRRRMNEMHEFRRRWACQTGAQAKLILYGAVDYIGKQGLTDVTLARTRQARQPASVCASGLTANADHRPHCARTRFSPRLLEIHTRRRSGAARPGRYTRELSVALLSIRLLHDPGGSWPTCRSSRVN
jgi:hypothetical protein